MRAILGPGLHDQVGHGRVMICIKFLVSGVGHRFKSEFFDSRLKLGSSPRLGYGEN